MDIHTVNEDRELAVILELMRANKLQVRIRGTDDRPVIQFIDKLYKREVGGIELKRRLNK